MVAALGDSVATFTVVDISTDAGAAMAEQYRVASSALIVCRWEQGSMAESVDLTTMAFAHARVYDGSSGAFPARSHYAQEGDDLAIDLDFLRLGHIRNYHLGIHI